ncbi:hypothetical protein [Nonomuraea polychroma]|uniref:hypothetical protein n=1 Tax=Nonomuraea polychroma TaxID=46176 RepID=UPI000FDE16C1|nr:hypothetical protein [Nonomuraea polychroma]
MTFVASESSRRRSISAARSVMLHRAAAQVVKERKAERWRFRVRAAASPHAAVNTAAVGSAARSVSRAPSPSLVRRRVSVSPRPAGGRR